MPCFFRAVIIHDKGMGMEDYPIGLKQPEQYLKLSLSSRDSGG
jgi:hypothetical protein